MIQDLTWSLKTPFLNCLVKDDTLILVFWHHMFKNSKFRKDFYQCELNAGFGKSLTM